MFAELEIHNKALVAGLAGRTLLQGFMSTFNPQNVADTACAFATLGIQNEALMARLAQRALQQGFLSTFSPQNATNTAWVFATPGIQSEALMAGLTERTLQEGFLPVHLQPAERCRHGLGVRHTWGSGRSVDRRAD